MRPHVRPVGTHAPEPFRSAARAASGEAAKDADAVASAIANHVETAPGSSASHGLTAGAMTVFFYTDVFRQNLRTRRRCW